MNTWISNIMASGLVLFVAMTSTTYAHEQSSVMNQDGIHAEKPTVENLMKSRLEGANGTEVIVSRVSIPPNTPLPKHWHPGEEFAYVVEGSVILWQQGKADILGNQGDVIKVPLKQIHTAKTQDEGVVLLVFRVHESDKPERTIVD